VPTITELKPSIMSVHEGNDTTKYFLSSRFAFIHANFVANIIAIEAVPIDRIDQSLVQKGLAEFNQKLSSAAN
jgi:F-type H+-transporting ATPase subunit delta